MMLQVLETTSSKFANFLRGTLFCMFSRRQKTYPTKRKPDLRACGSLPLSYIVFEGISPTQVIRFLANWLRGR